MMKYLILIIILQVSILLGAQTGNISGLVTDRFGMPIQQVNIAIAGKSGVGTSTDILGKFMIFCQSQDTLVFSHIGFYTHRHVVITEDLTVNTGLHIQLDASPLILETVDIIDTRSRKLRYTIDFEQAGDKFFRLEIYGNRKYLILFQPEGPDIWKCQLPKHMQKCSQLTRDFMQNPYLLSDDSVYQVVATEHGCQILPGILRERYHSIMDQCLAYVGESIVTRTYGEFNKSVTIRTVNRFSKTIIYQQEDLLAFMHCRDLIGAERRRAGLGFELIDPESAALPAASLYRNSFGRSMPAGGISHLTSKPIKVECHVIHDTIIVFDHFADQQIMFDGKGHRLANNSIHYRSEALIGAYLQDPAGNRLYAQFRNKRGVYLQEIDWKAGFLTGVPIELNVLFPEKIRLYRNRVYFLEYDPINNRRKLRILKL